MPEGFVDPLIGGFVGALGPIFRRDLPGGVTSGFRVAERHCNPQQVCHGGWLATFADVALVREALLSGGGAVTMGMAIDYLEPVRLGAWVESRTETVRANGRTVVVQGSAVVDGRAVLRMNGTYRLGQTAEPQGGVRER